MKQVKVKNFKGEIIETVKVKKVPTCFCGKEMHILQDGHDRMWKCECMKEWIRKCTHCEDWVYEDMCYPEDFDGTLGLTFYYGHRHCMKKKAKELRKKKERAPKYFWKLVDFSKNKETHQATYRIINAHTMTDICSMTDIYCALKEKFGSNDFYLYYDVTCNEHHIMSQGEIIGKLNFNDSLQCVLYPKKLAIVSLE